MVRKILLIDDSINLLQALKKRFEMEIADVEVLTATEGKDGFAIAVEEVPALVFLDINMPGINGDEVLKKMRAIKALDNTKIIILTAHGPELRDEYLELGATEYIPSPFDTTEIVEKVKGLLG